MTKFMFRRTESANDSKSNLLTSAAADSKSSKLSSKDMTVLKKFWKGAVVKLLTLIRVLLDLFTEFFFGFIYKDKSETLPPIKDLLLLESAQSLAAKIRVQKVKSEDLIKAFIDRIKEVNPIINAVVDQRYEDALKEAREVDKLIASGQMTANEMAEEKPFLGIPFTIKDCFPVKGLRQTAGLYARRNVVADDDAPVVKLMRNAGAIPIAVTNVSELCMWWESSNKVYGRTRNPYNTTRIVGGSSGGEGAMLGAAGTVIGIGSDIGGSLRMPAYFNGIFTHKPTREIVPNDGQIPIALDVLQKFLCTGPMCRYASDLLPMYRVLSKQRSDKLSLNTNVNLKNLKFYYADDDGGFPIISRVHPEIKASIQRVVTHLEKAYSIKVQKVNIKELYRSLEIWSVKMGSSSTPSYCELLTDLTGEVNPWTEFFKWTVMLSNHTLPAIGLAIVEKFKAQPGTARYNKLIDMAVTLEERFKDLLGTDGIFLYPTNPSIAPYHNQPIFMPMNFAYTGIFNIIGLPVTQCPLGLSSDGLPLGLQVIANHYQDHLSLAVALELEKAFGGWVSPSAIP